MINKNSVVIAPHLDDAIFSAFKYINRTNKHNTVKIITICAGVPDSNIIVSSWDKRCGFTTGKNAAISRKKEDILACEFLNIEYEHLDFLDLPYSGIKQKNEIIKSIIRKIQNTDEIVIPLGIGQHSDHIIVRNSMIKIIELLSINKVYFYADLPYFNAYKYKLKKIKTLDICYKKIIKQLRNKGIILKLVEMNQLNHIEIKQKMEAVSFYQSQLMALKSYYPGIQKIDGELSIEALWKLAK